MDQVTKGIVAGIVFGVIAVAMMLPMRFPDKRTALSAAFINRYAIGFVVAVAEFGAPGWLTGAVIGLLLSLPDALITKAYAPVLGVGIVGATIIGAIVHT